MESLSLQWQAVAGTSSLAPLAFETRFPADLQDLPTPPGISGFLRSRLDAPLATSDTIRKTIRDALRGHGYKPTGRGKPASEYLHKAVASGRLSPDHTINVAVDACNAVSLHSGLPISVIDLERTEGTLTLRIAPMGTRYVFNPSGQTIDVGGLWCLFDAVGVCAAPVKDSQRTKTHPNSRHTLSILWSATALGEHAKAALAWYRQLLGHAGGDIRAVPIETLSEYAPSR